MLLDLGTFNLGHEQIARTGKIPVYITKHQNAELTKKLNKREVNKRNNETILQTIFLSIGKQFQLQRVSKK